MRRYDPIIYLEPVLFGPESAVDVVEARDRPQERDEMVRPVMIFIEHEEGRREKSCIDKKIFS